jgi:hypothetical protein
MDLLGGPSSHHWGYQRAWLGPQKCVTRLPKSASILIRNHQRLIHAIPPHPHEAQRDNAHLRNETMTLYHWALVDKKGKTRMTCEAPSYKEARIELVNRRGRFIPALWDIIKRGPVKTEAKPAHDSKPEPRPFKVGDRVKISNAGHQKWGDGDDNPVDLVGTVDGSDETWIDVMWDNGWHNTYNAPEQLELIEPAPDPPTPEELFAEAISQSTKLAAQFQEALGMPEASWPDMVAKAKALSQFKAVHQSNTAAKLDKIKAALMGYDAAKLGGDAYSVVEQFI